MKISVLKTAQLKKNADCTHWPASYIYNHFGNLAHITVLWKKMLYWTVILENKNITRENYNNNNNN